jgi:hypothetical protein
MDWDEIFLRAAGVRRFNEAKEINSKKRAAEKRYKKALEEADTERKREEAREKYRFNFKLLASTFIGINYDLLEGYRSDGLMQRRLHNGNMQFFAECVYG